MPEQRKLEKWSIFCESWKKWPLSCYTDWLLANQIAGKPVCISGYVITTITKTPADEKSRLSGVVTKEVDELTFQVCRNRIKYLQDEKSRLSGEVTKEAGELTFQVCWNRIERLQELKQ